MPSVDHAADTSLMTKTHVFLVMVCECVFVLAISVLLHVFVAFVWWNKSMKNCLFVICLWQAFRISFWRRHFNYWFSDCFSAQIFPFKLASKSSRLALKYVFYMESYPSSLFKYTPSTHRILLLLSMSFSSSSSSLSSSAKHVKQSYVFNRGPLWSDSSKRAVKGGVALKFQLWTLSPRLPKQIPLL